MTVLKSCSLTAVLLLAACAHAPTGDEYRAAAEAQFKAAGREKAEADPYRVGMPPRVVVPSAQDSTPLAFSYGPTEGQLRMSEQRRAAGFKHLKSARQLEQREDATCGGIPESERRSCPLIAPHVEKMEEGLFGVSLQMKTAATAKALAAQMQCHLAFAQANSFDRPTCPLFIRGVSIELAGDRTIQITSRDPGVARAVKEEARRMFEARPSS